MCFLLKNTKWKENEYSDNEGKFTIAISNLEKQGRFVVECYNWNDKMEKEGYVDELKVGINHEEYAYWIDNEAYK